MAVTLYPFCRHGSQWRYSTVKSVNNGSVIIMDLYNICNQKKRAVNQYQCWLTNFSVSITRIWMKCYRIHPKNVFICIYYEKMRSDHKWSLETHVEIHYNARCKLTYLECPLVIGRPKTHFNATYEQCQKLIFLGETITKRYLLV